jgi:uncharacterized protein YjbJ (UPF0337 family)
MHASAIIALGAAALAAAAPTTQQKKDSFEVSKFVFGCTSGCYYNFDVAYNGGETYHCAGALTDTDYLQCTGADDNLTAYIDNATDKTKNILKLQYEDSDVEAGTRYNYYGHKRVYAATSSDADKQKAKFAVKVSSATGVAK